MIDYVIVIFKNYVLAELQIRAFEKYHSKVPYRLILVDNTPPHLRRFSFEIPPTSLYVPVEKNDSPFDGESHGRALNFGVEHAETPIVGIFDSDFFLLSERTVEYALQKFQEGYKAVGCEYNDGHYTQEHVDKHPERYANIPCCFGAYYDLDLAKSESWVLEYGDLYAGFNKREGFIEVGWRIRKRILDERIPTLSWKTPARQYGNCFFYNELAELMGVHFVAGSHRRWGAGAREELEHIIDHGALAERLRLHRS